MEPKTYAEEIEEMADGESIVGVLVGPKGWGENFMAIVQSWEDARPSLDYTYDSGYGGVRCHSLYAYTENNIIYCWQYDGSTQLSVMPRNPIPCEVEMPGG